MQRLFVAALAVIFASIGAYADTRSEARIGQWDVSSFFEDRTGNFGHCAAGVPYKSGIFLIISIDRDFRWRMGFINPAWRLTKGEMHPIQYWIDNSGFINASAAVAATDMVIVELLDNRQLFEYFRRGRTLSVRASGETFQFDLTNSSRSLQTTFDCAVRYAGGGGQPASANPFAPAPPEQANRVDADLRTEAAIFTANLLSAANIPGFKMTASAPGTPYESYHSVFVAPGLVGGVVIAPAMNIPDATASVASTASKGCNGALASAQLPSQGDAVHMRVLCTVAGKPSSESNYYVVPRSSGGIYLIELSTAPESSGAVSQLPQDDGRQERIKEFSGKALDASLRR